MRVTQVTAKFVAARFAAASLSLLVMLWSLIFGQNIFGQEKPERFWVAGRMTAIALWFTSTKLSSGER